MTIFISYSTVPDQLMALRLQALAVVHGLSVFVPSVETRRRPFLQLTDEVRAQLANSSVVLAIILQNPLPVTIAEIQYASALGKTLIPILSPVVSKGYYAKIAPHFVVDLQNPSQVEQQIVEYLKGRDNKDGSQATLIAIAALAVGLLLLAAAQPE